jgi:hypothetical protein
VGRRVGVRVGGIGVSVGVGVGVSVGVTVGVFVGVGVKVGVFVGVGVQVGGSDERTIAEVGVAGLKGLRDTCGFTKINRYAMQTSAVNTTTMTVAIWYISSEEDCIDSPHYYLGSALSFNPYRSLGTSQ